MGAQSGKLVFGGGVGQIPMTSPPVHIRPSPLAPEYESHEARRPHFWPSVPGGLVSCPRFGHPPKSCPVTNAFDLTRTSNGTKRRKFYPPPAYVPTAPKPPVHAHTTAAAPGKIGPVPSRLIPWRRCSSLGDSIRYLHSVFLQCRHHHHAPFRPRGDRTCCDIAGEVAQEAWECRRLKRLRQIRPT